VTTALMIATILGIISACAHAGRAAVMLSLSYLALRHSHAHQRKEILDALGPVLHAVGSTELQPQTIRSRGLESQSLS
jgi:hypothetical protein